MYHVLIPDSLDIPDRLAKYKDEIYYFVHLVASPYVDHKERHSEFVNINKKILEKFIHPSYMKPIGDWLLAEVFDCDNHYIEGKKSKGYKLKERHKTKLNYKTIKKKTLNRKLAEWKKTRVPDTSINRRLNRDLGRVTIDREAAMDTAWANRSEKWEFHKQAAAIDRIADQGVRIDRQCDYGRIHSPITRLHGPLRKHLRIDGNDKLVNIDIANSQVVFLCLFMRDRGVRLGEFFDKTLDGTIYDYILTIAKERGVLPKDMERERFKGDFFHYILYGDTSKGYIHASDIAAIFREVYPGIWKWINKYKAEHGYRELARRMQRMESDFVVRHICPKIPEDIAVITVHDSFITTAADGDFVFDCLARGFLTYFGITPTIKHEYLYNYI